MSKPSTKLNHSGVGMTTIALTDFVSCEIHSVASCRVLKVYCFARKKLARLNLLKNTYGLILDYCRNLEKNINTDMPVFLEKHSAFKYGNSLEGDYAIVKLFVADKAIFSKNLSLHIESTSINNKLLHGCYPSCSDERVYIKNPNFEKVPKEIIATC